MWFRASLIAAAAVAAWGACTPRPDPTLVHSGLENCTNGVDDNADGKTDCADPKCFQDSACILSQENCGNGKDDNGDGKTDCLDPACAPNPSCAAKEVCAGGGDEDGDGKADCADPDCEGQGCGPGCTCLGGVRREVDCSDVADNDLDGKADCLDQDCSSAPGCQLSEAERCDDGLDNDDDSLTDCQDLADCTGVSCGTGCVCGGGAKTETACADSADNDNDSLADCQDLADCTGASCGTGCVCGGGSKTETACSDGVDNDGDLSRDCADSDCFGQESESCADLLDNNCDRAIDCADSKCAASPACANLSDGLPCASDSQCGGGKCRTEAATGDPNGACSNSVSCSVSAQTGCRGGLCVEAGSFDLCRMRCTGTGLGATGRCRAGYACLDTDSDTTNSTNYCLSLCSSDAECQGGAAGYGCNLWSKRCEQKDKGLSKYGAPCSSASQCESGYCTRAFPGGYCIGVCSGTQKSCGPDGACYYYSSFGDNIGACWKSCSTNSQCRQPDYHCENLGQGKICTCRLTGEPCLSNSECCSGMCDVTFSTCY